jgi:4,5-DOPA dioxygenase extradiol
VRGAPADEIAPWAKAFDDWLVEAAARGDEAALLDWERAAPNGRRAHPREEHFMPFFVALGAAGEGAEARPLHRSWSHGALSMTALAWD